MSAPTMEATAVREFRVDIPDGELDDLRRRLGETRFPEKETVTHNTQGVQLATMEATGPASTTWGGSRRG